MDLPKKIHSDMNARAEAFLWLQPLQTLEDPGVLKGCPNTPINLTPGRHLPCITLLLRLLLTTLLHTLLPAVSF